MSTGQSAVMLCSWGVKTQDGSFRVWINVWVAGKNLCDLSSTCGNLNALETSIAHVKKCFTNVLFTYFTAGWRIKTDPLATVSRKDATVLYSCQMLKDFWANRYATGTDVLCVLSFCPVCL